MNMKILLTVKTIGNVNKPDTGHDYSIEYLGGKSGEFDWQHTEAQAISYIEQGLFDYFIREDSQNLLVKLGVTPEGRKYLKVDADEEIPLSKFHLPTPA